METNALESSLNHALKRLTSASSVDSAVIGEVVKDTQRAMLQAGVSVTLVMKLSKNMKNRMLNEPPAAGISSKEQAIRVFLTELAHVIGKTTPVNIAPQSILVMGLDEYCTVDTAMILAEYFSRHGLKSAVVRADVPGYVPQSYQGLESKCDVNVVYMGYAFSMSAIEKIGKLDVAFSFTHKFLVVDNAISQPVDERVRAFNDVAGITGAIVVGVNHLDRGIGMLSAIADAGIPVAFIIYDTAPHHIEYFNPHGYISRLLHMGDLKALNEISEYIFKNDKKYARKTVTGKLSLDDMCSQFEAINDVSSINDIISILPIGERRLTINSENQIDRYRLKKYRAMIDSMTEKEKENPAIIDRSRLCRIARGSGKSIDEVRELLHLYKKVQRTMKNITANHSDMKLKKYLRQAKI